MPTAVTGVALVLDGNSRRSSQITALYFAVFKKIQQVGVIGFARFCAAKLSAWRQELQRRRHASNAFDDEFGTDTAKIVPLWKLTVEGPHREQGHRYQASDPEVVQAAIEKLAIRPEDFVFIDIGSGKGLTLLVACLYPFRSVVGVEFSPELNEIAVENIRRFNSPKRKCETVLSVCADAANYEFPAQKSLFYLYNPFNEDVLQRMLVNLRNSLKQSWREVYLVYINIKPASARLLDETDFLERIETPLHVPNKMVVVYKNKLMS